MLFLELEQSGLNAHNRFRNVHDAPPLILNQKLSEDAAAWAKTLAGSYKLSAVFTSFPIILRTLDISDFVALISVANIRM